MEVFAGEYPIENLKVMLSQISYKIPDPVQALFCDYFNQVYEKHTWLHFEGGLPKSLATTLFMHWLVEYPSQRVYGKAFSLSLFCLVKTVHGS
jgi:hypothetical protein